MGYTVDEKGAVLVQVLGAAGAIVGGSGANEQVAYWTGANTLDGDAGFTYDPATDTATLAGGFVMTGAANAVLTVNGGVANAFTLVDDNAIEYLRLDTDPQLVVIWNHLEADIDFRIAWDEGPNAFFVRGSDGFVGIGDNANTNMTRGLTINQGANDDEIFALKSSDVGHGMTTQAETDTYGLITKREGDSGGLKILGLKDADGAAGLALVLEGALGEAADTTKTIAGIGIVNIEGAIKTGTTFGQPGANSNILTVGAYNIGTLFIFDTEGEMHSDAIIGVGDDWDDWDDLALAADLSRLPKAKWNEMMRYHAEDFERAGLLTLSTDEQGRQHALIKHKKMLQFTMCCFRDIHERMKRYEQVLLELGERPVLSGSM